MSHIFMFVFETTKKNNIKFFLLKKFELGLKIIAPSCALGIIVGCIPSVSPTKSLESGENGSELQGGLVQTVTKNNGFRGLIGPNRKFRDNGAGGCLFKAPFSQWYLKSKTGQQREVVILPDLRPESLGSFSVAYRNTSVSPLNFYDQMSNGEWLTTNKGIIFDSYKSRISSRKVNGAPAETRAYRFYTKRTSEKEKKGLVEISFDTDIGTVSRLSLNDGEGMRLDQEKYPQFFYSVNSRPLAFSEPPKINDEVGVLLKGDCTSALTRGIFTTIRVIKVEKTTTADGLEMIKAKGSINRTIAGDDADCVAYSSTYDGKGRLYGLVTHYDPVDAKLRSDDINIEITSVHDPRLKSYLSYGFAPDHRGNGMLWSTPKAPIGEKDHKEVNFSLTDWTLCYKHPEALTLFAQQKAISDLTEYMEEPICDEKKYQKAYCEAKIELGKLFVSQTFRPQACSRPDYKAKELLDGAYRNDPLLKKCAPQKLEDFENYCQNFIDKFSRKPQ